MPNIKLIASDMDGTLLDSCKRLPEGFLPLVEKLSDRGINFVAASGRQYFNIVKYFEPLKDRIFFISDSGGIVYYRNEVISACSMDDALCRNILQMIAAKKAGRAILSGEKSAYVLKTDAQDEAFLNNAKCYYARISLVDDWNLEKIGDPICKMAIYAKGQSESLLYPLLQSNEKNANVVVSGTDWVDVMDLKVSKGNALKFIQHMTGSSRDETMAFGDYPNDVTLLEESKYSYAMANGHPDLKKAAAYIAPGNDEGGVMKILQKLAEGLS